MTLVDYVAEQIRQMLVRYDNHKDGNYSAYIARTAIAATREGEKMGLR